MSIIVQQARVSQRFVQSFPHQEATHPSHAMWLCFLSHESSPEQELAKLLQRRLGVTHGHLQNV